MSDRTLVLHAGPHKTGTTYLQYRLKKAIPALAAQGWQYPDYGMVQFNQQQVYHWLIGDTANAGNVSEASLRALLAQHPRLILSSEDFVYLQRAHLVWLKDMMGGCNIEIILYLRTPVDLWPSHWQELVRHGRDITLLEYVSANAGWIGSVPGSTIGILDQLNKFSSVFGKDAIRLFCYDNLVREKIDVFEHFWREILRLDAPAPNEAARTINPSQSAEKIEMLRNLNGLYLERFGRAPGMNVLRGYQKLETEIQNMPSFKAFKQTFQEVAPKVILNSSQYFFRSRESVLLNNYRSRIENRASEERIYLQESFSRTIPYGERYWIDRHGFRDFIVEVFDRVNS